MGLFSSLKKLSLGHKLRKKTHQLAKKLPGGKLADKLDIGGKLTGVSGGGKKRKQNAGQGSGVARTDVQLSDGNRLSSKQKARAKFQSMVEKAKAKKSGTYNPFNRNNKTPTTTTADQNSNSAAAIPMPKKPRPNDTVNPGAPTDRDAGNPAATAMSRVAGSNTPAPRRSRRLTSRRTP